MIGQTVTVVHRTTVRDRYGNATVTEERADVAGCAVAPRTAQPEVFSQGRSAVIVGLAVYMPPGQLVDADDLFEVAGLTYEVDGQPGVWTSPYTGRPAGIEVALRRAEG